MKSINKISNGNFLFASRINFVFKAQRFIKQINPFLKAFKASNICFNVLLIDINECEREQTVCGDNSLCANSIGNYSCECMTGYMSPSGSNCVGKFIP